MSERTIAAISTPSGEGGIAVIRISGDDAVNIADKCFRSFSGKKLSALEGYSALYGEVVFEDRVIDDGVALVFLAPKSFTGENVVEISVHGGKIVARDVLRAVLNCGAFPADRGEFTKRAYLNGKMDLASAESIMEIISAKNETALKISRGAKGGRISKEIDLIIDELLKLCASFSAYSDYPDEDIEGLDNESFLKLLSEIEEKLRKLIITYDIGKTILDGVDCAIVGKPNVGKSTLMNLLCGSDRSIVTDVPGTTRDVVECRVDFEDVTLNLYDTAGIHETEDIVEKEGIVRSFSKIDTAQLVLAVFDLSREIDEDDLSILNSLSDNAIIILNKSDLENMADMKAFEGKNTVLISAKENTGVELLHKKIAEILKTDKISPDDTVLLNERQRSCVQRAVDNCLEAKKAFESGVTLDAVGIIVDDCLSALLELTGKRVTNEVTDEVFRRFCVGK